MVPLDDESQMPTKRAVTPPAVHAGQMTAVRFVTTLAVTSQVDASRGMSARAYPVYETSFASPVVVLLPGSSVCRLR